MIFVIAYPVINPVLVQIGPFPIRWYALAYIAGLVIGWVYMRGLVRRENLWKGAPRPSAASLDDLLVYAAIGVVFGGRLGYILFYNFDFYAANPLQALVLWEGGMSFHGGLIGAALAVAFFARRNKYSLLTVFDLCSAVVPIGLFLGRLANFIKPELWGRPTDVPWAMVFPGAGPLPRHPSQLYEAGLEGLVLFIVLALVVRVGGFQRPGLVTGIFAIGYGAARIFCEFFREPDPQLGFLFGGATMGMLLSLPVIAAGVVFLILSRKRAAGAREPST
ncbi:MAG TPA: prolipoprotein diacylglyceryl transferase [Beijerinckiaceae bacterium]|jgi:phosphatidylglycerol:prolipoprotein diacylglycerol transferase|nr:prolipoprotein diacylglyceryl transferase [Beijerinckiaceae bacterium]